MNRLIGINAARKVSGAARPRAGLARRAVSRGVRLTALTAAIGGVSAAPSVASTAATPFAQVPTPAPAGGACTEALGRFSERTASAGVGPDGDAGADFNGDGVNDVWMAQPFCDVGSVTDQGRVYLLSGKDLRPGVGGKGTAKVIRTINSPQPQAAAKFGFFISVIGDVNADGKDDIAIGTDSQDVGTNIDQGKAWVFNGATGAVLRTLDNPVPQPSARFGSRIGRAGDINGDSVPDVIVGASNNDVGANVDQGQAFIFNGLDGTLLRTLNMPAADAVPAAHFGLAVQGPGDAAGDTTPDQLVDAQNFTNPATDKGRMYLFNGATGNLVRRINDPVSQPGAIFGFQDVAPLSPGDLNGDGKVEIYGNGFLQDRTLADEGESWVFDGAKGTVLRTLTDPTPVLGGQFGWSMSKTDYNHQTDAVNDLYVGQAPHVGGDPIQNGGTYVFNGINGAVFKRLELPTSCNQTGTAADNGPALGWTNSAPGDLNGDGEPDYVAGAPFFDRGTTQDEGVLLAFMSNATTTATGC